jgi:uncharacterized protein (DUF1800 family)
MPVQIRLHLILPVLLILAGCATTKNFLPDDANDDQIVHLLNRLSFGPTPEAIAQVRDQGIDDYIAEQLKPASLAKSDDLQQRLADLTTLKASLKELSKDFEPPADQFKNMSEDERKQVNKAKNRIVAELQQAKVLRAILSPAQLQEVMVNFWFNHFNVFAEKGNDKIWIGDYERDAIRPHALGKFRDLLKATAQHPAMLFYLDNWMDTAPDSPEARGKKQGINENYAREILELHTLGVDGGYTQQDVTTLAEILTGWGLSNGKELWQKSDFYFNPRRHDFANKTLLGHKIAGSGEAEIESVLDILASHPSTARHIAFKLAQAFVADEPPKSLIDKLAVSFKETDGDITAVLHTLFYSKEFWDKQYQQNKFKSPFHYVVSAYRAGKVLPQGDTAAVQGALRNMGEPLYNCLTPNGYSTTKEQWMNPDALLKRIDFAKSLNKLFDQSNPEQSILQSLGKTWSQNTLGAIKDVGPKQKTQLLLNSPEFLYF